MAVTCAGFCRGSALQPWYPGMVHSSAPTLSCVTQNCTELPTANATSFAHAVAFACVCCHRNRSPNCCLLLPSAAFARRRAWPTAVPLPALLCRPADASSLLTSSLPLPPVLGNNQITSVAANYCSSYNLPIRLSLSLSSTLEHFHLSILSTFMLALVPDPIPFSPGLLSHTKPCFTAVAFLPFNSLLLASPVILPSTSLPVLLLQFPSPRAPCSPPRAAPSHSPSHSSTPVQGTASFSED